METRQPRVIVVDAANVVGSRPDGWWRDRPGAARRLLEKLTTLQQRLQSTTHIIVILEGAARRAVTGEDGSAEFGELRVVLADGSGDDTIVAVTAEVTGTNDEPDVTVVTADRGLRERVEAVGASVVGPRWLLEQVKG